MKQASLIKFIAVLVLATFLISSVPGSADAILVHDPAHTAVNAVTQGITAGSAPVTATSTLTSLIFGGTPFDRSLIGPAADAASCTAFEFLSYGAGVANAASLASVALSPLNGGKAELAANGLEIGKDLAELTCLLAVNKALLVPSATRAATASLDNQINRNAERIVFLRNKLGIAQGEGKDAIRRIFKAVFADIARQLIIKASNELAAKIDAQLAIKDPHGYINNMAQMVYQAKLIKENYPDDQQTQAMVSVLSDSAVNFIPAEQRQRVANALATARANNGFQKLCSAQNNDVFGCIAVLGADEANPDQIKLASSLLARQVQAQATAAAASTVATNASGYKSLFSCDSGKLTQEQRNDQLLMAAERELQVAVTARETLFSQRAQFPNQVSQDQVDKAEAAVQAALQKMFATPDQAEAVTQVCDASPKTLGQTISKTITELTRKFLDNQLPADQENPGSILKLAGKLNTAVLDKLIPKDLLSGGSSGQPGPLGDRAGQFSGQSIGSSASAGVTGLINQGGRSYDPSGVTDVDTTPPVAKQLKVTIVARGTLEPPVTTIAQNGQYDLRIDFNDYVTNIPSPAQVRVTVGSDEQTVSLTDDERDNGFITLPLALSPDVTSATVAILPAAPVQGQLSPIATVTLGWTYEPARVAGLTTARGYGPRSSSALTKPILVPTR